MYTTIEFSVLILLNLVLVLCLYSPVTPVYSTVSLAKACYVPEMLGSYDTDTALILQLYLKHLFSNMQALHPECNCCDIANDWNNSCNQDEDNLFALSIYYAWADVEAKKDAVPLPVCNQVPKVLLYNDYLDMQSLLERIHALL